SGFPPMSLGAQRLQSVKRRSKMKCRLTPTPTIFLRMADAIPIRERPSRRGWDLQHPSDGIHKRKRRELLPSQRCSSLNNWNCFGRLLHGNRELDAAVFEIDHERVGVTRGQIHG